MKFTKTLLIASAISTMAVLSTQAFADEMSYSNQTVITADASTKDVAFEQGLSELNNLQAASSTDLLHQFSLDMSANNVAVENGAYVTVTKKMSSDGQYVYNGVVHASLSYESDGGE
ncbi:DUF3316 domain-containing protein [Psychromonas sp. KJ10-10]|uniref:DUF3316 domain-containing protein n=1 Tax=Psychromonas sp. KJ10-10 TaxID=3391823 RepID=UPI0039B4F4CB